MSQKPECPNWLWDEITAEAEQEVLDEIAHKTKILRYTVRYYVIFT